METPDVPRIVDLSQPLSARTPRSSDHPQVEFQTIRWFSRDGLQTRQITASLHSGTHIDAPALFLADGLTVDQIPVDQMFGPGVVVDVPKSDWGVITAQDLEQAQPKIEPGDIVVLRTGWHQFYDTDEERYVLKGPGMNKDAVDWFVDRQVKMVCCDSPSAEHIFMRLGQWKTLRPDIFPADLQVDAAQFPPASYAHKTLFRNNILMIDNVGGDVDQVVGRRCTISALAARYAGVEGAPVRMVAILDE
jgi:kynurenine formamidase